MTTQATALREALLVARDHIDMDALRISHCKDAALIDAALGVAATSAGAQPTMYLVPDDCPRDDFDQPIIYITNEVNLVAHSLTGSEGEEDALTELKGMARYVSNVWPGKTALQVLLEYEEAALPSAKRVPLTDEQITKAMEDYGVKFLRFRGGLSGKKDVFTTSGSQDASKIIAAVRILVESKEASGA